MRYNRFLHQQNNSLGIFVRLVKTVFLFGCHSNLDKLTEQFSLAFKGGLEESGKTGKTKRDLQRVSISHIVPEAWSVGEISIRKRNPGGLVSIAKYLFLERKDTHPWLTQS